MHTSTRVFISATSADLGSTRQLVKEALLAIDCHPIEQTDFAPDYRTVEAALEEKIGSCQALLHIVGFRYGAGPDTSQLPSSASQRSYSQLEYDIASDSKNKVKLYVFVCGEDFLFDACESEPAELQRLQQLHRDAIVASPHLRTTVSTQEELGVRVREIRVELADLRAQVRRATRTTIAAISAILIVACVVIYGIIQLGARVGNVEETVQATSGRTIDEIRTLYEDPDVLAGQLKSRIRQRADEEIKREKASNADWRKIDEIEKRRDVALRRVDELIVTIRDGLSGEPDPIFAEAARLLVQHGIDEAVSYLEAKQSETLDEVDRIRERQSHDEEYKRVLLERLLLQADLHVTQQEWQSARELLFSVAEKAPQWSRAQRKLGVLLRDLAEYDAAEPHLESALVLAESDKQWVTSASSLGIFYIDIGRYEKAEPLLQELVTTSERLYGPASIETASALGNLAVLLRKTSSFSMAESHFRRSLAINEKCFGRNHSSVAMSLNNLGVLLQATNRPDEAEEILGHAVRIWEQLEGPDHSHVAYGLSNLALLLQSEDRLVEAELLMRRALAIDMQYYGQTHPNVARDLNNLGVLLKATNRTSEAEPILRHALIIWEQAIGSTHPNVASALSNLASLLKATNRTTAAELLYWRALTIDEQIGGNDSIDIARDLNNLALLLQETGRASDAAPLLRRALGITERSLSEDHPSVATHLANLAHALQSMQRLFEAEPLYRRALVIDESAHGPTHSSVARDVNNLANHLLATSRLAEAEVLMRHALLMEEQSSGPSHPNVARALNNLGQLLHTTSRTSEAEPLLCRALVIDERSAGPEHPTVARDLVNLSQQLWSTKRYPEAEQLLRRALEIYVLTGQETPLQSTMKANYTSILKKQLVTQADINQRLSAIEQIGGPLPPIQPQVEQMLGPPPSVATILSSIDAMPNHVDLSLRANQPITPQLRNFLSPTRESLSDQALAAFEQGANAMAIVLWEAASKKNLNQEDAALWSLTNHMVVGAALRELGDLERGEQQLKRSLSGLEQHIDASPLIVGVCQYHLAVCEFLLGKPDHARESASRSLKTYDQAAQHLSVPQVLIEQSEQVIIAIDADIKLPPRTTIDVELKLQQASARFEASQELATLSINQSVMPLLEQLLGPSPSDDKIRTPTDSRSLDKAISPQLDKELGVTQPVEEALSTLDAQYRNEDRPEIWYLPLGEPIGPYLDKLQQSSQ